MSPTNGRTCVWPVRDHERCMRQRPRETVSIRAASRADVDAIAAIYNEGMADRVATFETRLRGPSEVAEWFVDDLPFLVATNEAGGVVAFARVSPYSDRCVYSGVGEHGVYVARASRGGRGRASPARGARSRLRAGGDLQADVTVVHGQRRQSRRASGGGVRGGRDPASPRQARRRVEGLRAGRAAARSSGLFQLRRLRATGCGLAGVVRQHDVCGRGRRDVGVERADDDDRHGSADQLGDDEAGN